MTQVFTGPSMSRNGGPNATTPRGLTIDAAGQVAYVVNSGSNSVTPINTVTGSAGAAIAGGTNPFAVAISPDGTKAYYTNRGSGTVTPINVATGVAGSAITVGASPFREGVTPAGTE